MSDIVLYELNDDVRVNYTGKRAVLPPRYSSDCEAHWLALMETGKKYFRGDVFTIVEEMIGPGGITLSAEMTDYAHFIYTIKRGTFAGNDCRTIYTSAVILTSDGKFVVGIMGQDTFAPGKLQLTGGGVDGSDVVGGRIDLEHCIKKEIAEETGIDADDPSVVKNFAPYLLKTGGRSNFYSAIFRLDLKMDESCLTSLYRSYISDLAGQGRSPEFESLLFVPADAPSIMNLVESNQREKDENLVPALKATIGLFPVKRFGDKASRI